MSRFPPPNDEAFLLIDGKPIPVKSIPPEKWAEHRKKMMENVGRIMSDYIARGH